MSTRIQEAIKQSLLPCVGGSITNGAGTCVGGGGGDCGWGKRLQADNGLSILVQQIVEKNCAFCGKSVKFGTHIYHPKTCKFRTSAIAEFTLGTWQ